MATCSRFSYDSFKMTRCMEQKISLLYSSLQKSPKTGKIFCSPWYTRGFASLTRTFIIGILLTIFPSSAKYLSNRYLPVQQIMHGRTKLFSGNWSKKTKICFFRNIQLAAQIALTLWILYSISFGRIFLSLGNKKLMLLYKVPTKASSFLIRELIEICFLYVLGEKPRLIFFIMQYSNKMDICLLL